METTLPKVSFCNHQISKLLIGDNPIYGYLHFNQLFSQHQKEYHTPKRVVATFKRAEVGINGWQNSVTERSMSDLQRYRDEDGTMHWFCLSWSSVLNAVRAFSRTKAFAPMTLNNHKKT